MTLPGPSPCRDLKPEIWLKPGRQHRARQLPGLGMLWRVFLGTHPTCYELGSDDSSGSPQNLPFFGERVKFWRGSSSLPPSQGWKYRMPCPTFSFLLEGLGLGHGEALHHLVALASLLVLRARLVGRPDQHPAAEGVAVAPRRFLRPRNSVYWSRERERRRRGGVTSHISAQILPGKST